MAKQTCSVCKNIAIEIHEGPHGDYNWQTHINSRGHRLNTEAIKSKGPGLVSLFARQSAKQAERISVETLTPTLRLEHPSSSNLVEPSPPPLPPSRKFSNMSSSSLQITGYIAPTTPNSQKGHDKDSRSLECSLAQRTKTADPTSLDMITRLRTLASTLPPSINIAKVDGPLAFMSYGAVLSEEGEDPWETFDPVLNGICGSAVSKEKLEGMIERGEYGVDGLCNWLESIVRDFGIARSLLEGKLKRLETAMIACGASTLAGSYYVVDPLPIRGESEGHPIWVRDTDPEWDGALPLNNVASVSPQLQLTSTNLSSNFSSLLLSSVFTHKPSSNRVCCGLPFLNDGTTNPLSHYPWAIHEQHALEWQPEVHKGRVYLQSYKCARKVDSARADLQCCQPCQALQESKHYLNLVERIDHGCREGTTLCYLTPTQMMECIRRKTAQNKTLQLAGLNAGRILTNRLKSLDGHKRIITAVASGQVNRVHAVITVARRKGVGVEGLLSRLQQAMEKTYAARSYEESEYQRAELAL